MLVDHDFFRLSGELCGKPLEVSALRAEHREKEMGLDNLPCDKAFLLQVHFHPICLLPLLQPGSRGALVCLHPHRKSEESLSGLRGQMPCTVSADCPGDGSIIFSLLGQNWHCCPHFVQVQS